MDIAGPRTPLNFAVGSGRLDQCKTHNRLLRKVHSNLNKYYKKINKITLNAEINTRSKASIPRKLQQ